MNNPLIRRRVLWTPFMLVIAAGMTFGGTLKNGGTFRNTGTANYQEIQNYTTTAGTIVNSGTLNINQGSGTGNFLNTNGTLNGVLRNYIGGLSAGTVVCAGSTGNFTNGAATADNDSLNGYVGVIRLIGALTSTGTFDTDSGKVEYNGSGAQTVFLTTYGALVINGGNTKTLSSGTTTVNDSLRIDNSTTLAISTFELDVKGATAVAQNIGVLSAGSGTVLYNGDRNQTIIPATYKTLTLTGSSTAHRKTASGGISFAASGALNVGTLDSLDVTSGTLDLSTNNPTLTNNSGVRVGGTASFGAGVTTAGTFYYYGAGAQSIGAATYSDLILGGAGAKNFTAGTVAVTGNYTINPGAGARNYSTGTFQFAGTSGTQTIAGLSSESFNILQFSGAAAKSISSGNLGAATVSVLSGSGLVTNNATFAIGAGGLTVQSSASLTNSSSLTVTGGDITNDGIITNDGTITAN
jgi:hypothetical protein